MVDGDSQTGYIHDVSRLRDYRFHERGCSIGAVSE
jgi:hypothetical protein